MRYNHHFASHFSSCVLLASAFDPHRNRQVQLRALPGEFSVVGVTDGVDAWIAPVAGDPFSVNIARIIEEFARTGRVPGTDLSPRSRRALPHVVPDPTPPADQPRQRKQLVAAQPVTDLPRRRNALQS